MVFYADFNIISVKEQQQLTLFMSFLCFTSTRLGSERSLAKKSSNPGPLDYESNTLPLSHAGLLLFGKTFCFVPMPRSTANIFMLPKGCAYTRSCQFVCQSFLLSVQSHFSTTPGPNWIKTLGQCTFPSFSIQCSVMGKGYFL